MKEFIRHPADMGAPEVEAYLTYLIVEHKVSPSTQNVAMQAITGSVTAVPEASVKYD